MKIVMIILDLEVIYLKKDNPPLQINTQIIKKLSLYKNVKYMQPILAKVLIYFYTVIIIILISLKKTNIYIKM